MRCLSGGHRPSYASSVPSASSATAPSTTTGREPAIALFQPAEDATGRTRPLPGRATVKSTAEATLAAGATPGSSDAYAGNNTQEVGEMT